MSPRRTTLDYCDAEVDRLHETFGCLEPAGHDGPHRADSTYGDGCPNCGGLDLHSEECPTPDLEEDRSQPFKEVVWDQGSAEARLEVYDPKAVHDTWCPHCGGTGRIKQKDRSPHHLGDTTT